MTTERIQDPRQATRRALWTGALLGLVTLLAFLAQPIFEFVNTVEANKVLRSVHATDLLRGALLVDVLQFALALVAVHIALGLVAAGLALATGFAFRGLRSTPPAQLTVLWYVAIVGWVIGANAAWFPWSNAGAFYAGYFNAAFAGHTALEIYSAALACGCAAVLATFAARLTLLAARPRVVAATLGLAFASALVAGIGGSSQVSAAARAHAAKPNLVIVGIDSLRLEQLAAFGGGGLTPNIDRAVGSSRLFRDTISPMARTFPSWISILSGRYPDSTGASINLVDRQSVHAGPTLAETLRRNGYSTVFATDEVRFSNIDRSYGFDEVITPKIGAADFLLGMFNDFPVSNVLANTRVARLLFPHTYSNRAAATRYEPETFLELLDRELHPDGPAFVAVHLTMPHWPYLWSEAPSPPKGMPKQEAELWVYRNALAVADRQFGEVLDLLAGRGILENAIVVVLSDHGEALFQPGDRLIPKDLADIAGATRPVEVPTFGHGASVLSPVQFQVLLAVSGAGPAARLVGDPVVSGYPASLVDVAPTLLGLLGLPPPAHLDGTNLFAATDASAANRIRYTETEFNLPMVLAGQPDPAALALQGADYYTVDEHSGWLEFRKDKFTEIDARRERAALSGKYILAGLPTLEGNSRFVLAERASGAARIVTDPRQLPADAQGLWQALHVKYGEFLGPPST